MTCEDMKIQRERNQILKSIDISLKKYIEVFTQKDEPETMLDYFRAMDAEDISHVLFMIYNLGWSDGLAHEDGEDLFGSCWFVDQPVSILNDEKFWNRNFRKEESND